MTTQLPLDMTEDPGRAPRKAPASFHVRSHVSVAEAEAGEQQAKGQELAILTWYREQDAAVPGVKLRPSQVHEHFEQLDKQWPLTSIRRAISNLTRKGHLMHWPGVREAGPLGAKESTWSLSIFDGDIA